MEVSGVKTWVVLAKYRLFSQVKEKSGVIRVDEFQQSCAMQSDGKMGAKGRRDVGVVWVWFGCTI